MSAALEVIYIKFYRDIVEWWKFRRVVFVIIIIWQIALRQYFKPQLYQIRKSRFCVQFCGSNRRQHYVILLVNDQSKSLVYMYTAEFTI